MVTTVLAGCAAGGSKLLPAGVPSAGRPALGVLKVKVGRATKRIPASVMRRSASVASPTPVQQIGPGYTAATSDGNAVTISGDGADLYDYDYSGDLLVDHDTQQTGDNGMPVYRMTGTNGTEVQIELCDLTKITYDQSTTIGDFTMLQSSSSSLATVTANVGSWGQINVSVQPGDTGFVATSHDGQTTTYDYGLFGISQTQAAALRRAAQSIGRHTLDFNPSATCLALIAILIALLLAAAYFGWYYIGLAFKLAAFNAPLGVVNATLARTVMITALTAVAGATLAGGIIKECFKDPTPTPKPTDTPTPKPTDTPTPSGTSTPTPSGTNTPTPSGSGTPTPSGSGTPTPSGSGTPTPSGSPSPMPTPSTPPPSPSASPMPTPSTPPPSPSMWPSAYPSPSM